MTQCVVWNSRKNQFNYLDLAEYGIPADACVSHDFVPVTTTQFGEYLALIDAEFSSACLVMTRNDQLVISDKAAGNCVSYDGFSPLSQQEFSAYQALMSSPSGNQSIVINSDLYVLVSGYILLSFFSGHVLGKILKRLGK
ncbi:hypothetical protein MHO82_24670 [Vibrio sp. Of7-15]|uniref:hypothetical protein n=1 Tax=Vibrio sp. Of7-15 TaxID=2724879 RepID=UPI001EF1F6FE|nr:hypothetical protein [Vibrio sp. Of7-15]MCG7500062.1 hypothetical protein [Vibrio sp. Of7-15]